MLQINAKNFSEEKKYTESSLEDSLKNSKLIISNNGDISIIDNSNKTLWELKLKSLK